MFVNGLIKECLRAGWNITKAIFWNMFVIIFLCVGGGGSMFFPLNCTTSRWIKIGAAFQSASDVAVVQKAGKFTFITMVSKNKRISLQTLHSMCVSSWKIWQDSGVSMEIFLFLVGQILKSGNVHDLGHGGFMRLHGNQFPTVRLAGFSTCCCWLSPFHKQFEDTLSSLLHPASCSTRSGNTSPFMD